MLTHPNLEKLKTLRFTGMSKALEEQINMSEIDPLSFEERLGLMLDREMTERSNKRFKTKLKKSNLRQNAAVEDIDYRHQRGLDKSLMMSLISCE